MADQYLISVGVKADFSDLQAQQQAAQASLKQAQAAWEEAYAQLGKAAEQGSAQAIAALKEYEVALTEAKSRAESTTAALNAANAEMKELTAAGNSAASSTHNLTNSFYAAQGASRLMKGEMPTRAFERLVAQSEILGKALMAAFPLMGLAGFGMLVTDVIERIVTSYLKVRDAANAAAEAIRTSWADANETLRRSNNELESSLDSTIAQTEKLLGKHDISGATAAFDEIRRSADQIGKSIDSDLKKFDELIKKKENTIGTWGQLFTGKAATTDTEKLLEGVQKKIRNKADDSQEVVDRAEESGNRENLDHAQTSRIVVLQQAYKEATSDITDRLKKLQLEQNNFESGSVSARDQTANINLLSAALRNLAEQQRTIGLEYAAGQAKAAEASAKNTKQQVSDASKQQKAAGAALMDRIQLMEFSNKEQDRITTEVQEYGARLLKLDDESLKSAEKTEQEKQRLAREVLVRQAEAAVSAEQSAVAQLDADKEVAEASIQYELSTGKISQQTAAHRLAALHAQYYAGKVKTLREELEALKAVQASGGDTTKQQDKVSQEIVKVEGQGKAQGFKDNTKGAGEYAKAWDGALMQVGRRFATIQSQMLMGQISFASAMRRMAAETANSFILYEEKRVAKYLMGRAQEAVAHWASETQKSAATATGAVTRESIEDAASMKSKIKSAKDAFHGTYAAISHIPIVGPVLAPIAAAGAFAAVMAFEKGGIIPGSVGSAVPILGHAGEAVLPQPLTKMLTETAQTYSGGGGKGPSTTNVTFNGVTDAKAFFAKHQGALLGVLAEAAKNRRKA